MPELAPINICTGCTACMSVCPKNCITMESDKEGFRYPKLNDKSQCINCGKCELVCPVKNKVEYPLPTAYAAYSNEDSLRSESSSGGVFSEFARYILNQSGVVYGAQYDDNFNVKHTRTDNKSVYQSYEVQSILKAI